MEMVICSHTKSSFFRYSARMEKYPYLNEAVGNVLSRYRLSLAMSKKKLSETAFIERAYITGLESGKWNVSLNVLFFLSDALGVSPDVFVRQVMDEVERLKTTNALNQ